MRKVTQLNAASHRIRTWLPTALFRIDQVTALRCIERAYPYGQRTGLRL